MFRSVATLSVVFSALAWPAVAGPMRESPLIPGSMPRALLDRNVPDAAAKAIGAAESEGIDKFRLNLSLSRNVTVGPVVSVARNAAQAAAGSRPMALGGFVEIAYDQFRFDGSLSGGNREGFVADLGAAFESRLPGLGTVYRVRLGAEWANGDQSGSYFSVSPALSAFGADADGLAGYRDVSVAVSFTHDITPSFYVAGIAGAKRVLTELSEGSNGPEPNRFHLGAGLGFRF